MNKEMKEWEEKKGIKFLERIGIKSGQKILDFGARVGHYSIPAATIVGVAGKVYALDKNNDSLNELKRKAEKQKLENITLIKTNGNFETGLENNSVDIILAYDVLHLINDRKKLYKEIFRVLQKNGLFSVYPKHNKLDNPKKNFANLNPKDIIKEIKNHNFYFEKEYCGLISHDEFINKGCVLNFRKKRILSE